MQTQSCIPTSGVRCADEGASVSAVPIILAFGRSETSRGIVHSGRLSGDPDSNEWQAAGSTALLAAARARGFSADGHLVIPPDLP